jgi:hypothetical protein
VVPRTQTRRGAAALLCAVVALTGCQLSPRRAAVPRPLAPRWQAVSLPAAAGGHIALGDLVNCAGTWYALGGVIAADGTSRPALWSSVDGQQWTERPTHPVSVYGPLAVFYSAACADDGRLAAIAAVAGGVHANPRTGTWHSSPDGGLVEVDAPFERYGGPNAISVDRVAGAAGGAGYVIAGNRVDHNGMAGAAAWYSPTGEQFTLLDGDPALMSTADGLTGAAGAAGVPDGWLLVGSVLRPGAPAAARDPLAWSSSDGTHWRREDVPGSPAEDEALMRVARWQQGALAVGVRGGGFGAWLRGEPDRAAAWRSGGAFGQISGTALPAVTGFAVAGDAAYVAVCDGSAYRLWTSSDGTSWREVSLPVTMAAGAQRRLLVAGDGRRVLAAIDNGTGVRLWLAPQG